MLAPPPDSVSSSERSILPVAMAMSTIKPMKKSRIRITYPTMIVSR
jgi:hypothetical protein